MNEQARAAAVDKLFVINEYGYKHQNPAAIPDPELVEHYAKEYGIRTDLHRTCTNCQIRQVEKYKQFDEGKPFAVKCDGIAKRLPLGAARKLKQLAASSDVPYDRAKKLMLSTIDPVAWIELMFGFTDDDPDWQVRNYQKEQIRCTANRVVIREGRRTGKTFAMALKLLYHIFNTEIKRGRDSEGSVTSRGPSIMIITPFTMQLTNIFNEMEQLLKRNIDLKNECSSGTGGALFVKTPNHKMTFNNGAMIQGFVSGTGVKEDGSGGGTMRGQSADIIYLDEMDMIPEEILDKVITPILATWPDTIMYATSTPIGKRGKFYNWCLERPDFKEDYLPSTMIPHWERIKHEFENDGTKESFAAEYMAEFIDFGFGVFRPSWIALSKADYSYDQVDTPGFWRRMGVKDRANMIISIGIDWNKNAGSEFFVTGYSTDLGLWFALEAVNIPASNFSSKRWKEEVVRLNAKWKPDWIYADEGYGHTIIEDLKLHAHRVKMKAKPNAIDQQTVQLIDRLVAYNFSSSIKMRDPIDGTELKKAAKHYLVENAVSIMEDSLFKYPHSDDRLSKQLGNYIVVKRNSAGKPVYGMSEARVGDHRLDAWMLSLVALALEESVYSGKGLVFSTPGFISKQNLDEREVDSTDIAAAVQKAGVPGMLSVVELVRGQKSGWKANESESRGGRGSRSHRGDVTNQQTEGFSHLFSGLAKHSESLRGDDEYRSGKAQPISAPSKAGPHRKRRGGGRGNILGG
jgi:hypothetical protein